MIEAVFFDVGETILSPNPSWSDLAVDRLGERGHDVTVERMREAWRHVGNHFIEAAEAGFMFSVNADDSKRFWTKLYLDQLAAAGGKAPGFDEAWLVYRQSLPYGLSAWSFTIGRAAYQPKMHPPTTCLALIRRLSTAVDDLDSLGALGIT